MRPMPRTRPRAFVGACAAIALAAALAEGSVAAEPQEASSSAAPPVTSEPQQQPVSPPKGSAEAIALLERIEPLIERAHAGGTHHLGRKPSRFEDRIDLRELRMKLVRELDEAVAAEQYERAAKLRDRLHGLGGEGEPEASPESGA